MFNQQFKHLLFELNRRFILQKYRDLGVSGKSDSNPPPPWKNHSTSNKYHSAPSSHLITCNSG